MQTAGKYTGCYSVPRQAQRLKVPRPLLWQSIVGTICGTTGFLVRFGREVDRPEIGSPGGFRSGAGEGVRTLDHLLGKQELYH